MLSEDNLRDAVLLVLANKQDLRDAMSPSEVADKLGLHSLKQRNWFVRPFFWSQSPSAEILYQGDFLPQRTPLCIVGGGRTVEA